MAEDLGKFQGEVPALEPSLPSSRTTRAIRLAADLWSKFRHSGSIPSFLGIGGHKAASTWLHYCLSEHAECFLPEAKETFYFQNHVDRPLSTYLAHFKGGRGKVIGEIGPTYSIIKEEFVRYVRSVNPRMKIILIMRNPIDREWSHMLMDKVQYGGKTLEELTEGDVMEHFDREYTQAMGDYASIIERWSVVFGIENLQTHFFEDIALRPREVLEEVFDFIGVSRAYDWNSSSCRKVLLKGPQLPMPREYRDFLRDKYAPMIERLAGLVGDRPLQWLETP